MTPLNQLTLIPSIYTCIALIDNVIYGYSHCKVDLNDRYRNITTCINFKYTGYLHQYWAKLLKYFCNLYHQWQDNHLLCTILNLFSAIVVFQKRDRVAMYPSSHILISQNGRVFFLNCIRNLDEFSPHIALLRMKIYLSWHFSEIIFRSVSTVSIFGGLRIWRE